MPHRLVCVAILLFWAVAAVALFSRDILPDLLIGTPPDLRAISRADQDDGPTRWSLQVADDVAMNSLRSVGQAVTESSLRRDGWVEWSSEVTIDSAGLLKGTPFEAVGAEKLRIDSEYQIDPSGNLHSFRARVRAADEEGDLLTLDGRVEGKLLRVRARGPHPLLRWSRDFAYEPRGMVQNTLGPMDRMPGLQVGQRWESRVVSPLTGRVETVRVEVAGRRVITWGNNPVTTLEVVTRAAPLSVKTWVRPDGLVLRQEVPFPFVRLILERQPRAKD